MPRTYKRPMFAKRHYEVIAAVLAERYFEAGACCDHCFESVNAVIWAFEKLFSRDNERFDGGRFQKATTKVSR